MNNIDILLEQKWVENPKCKHKWCFVGQIKAVQITDLYRLICTNCGKIKIIKGERI
jgi:hypothetical protein